MDSISIPITIKSPTSWLRFSLKKRRELKQLIMTKYLVRCLNYLKNIQDSWKGKLKHALKLKDTIGISSLTSTRTGSLKDITSRRSRLCLISNLFSTSIPPIPNSSSENDATKTLVLMLPRRIPGLMVPIREDSLLRENIRRLLSRRRNFKNN